MQPTRSANDSKEFRNNYTAAEMVNALYALESGHIGRGVTVGLIDDGVLNVSGELDGRISALSKDFGYVTTGSSTTKREKIGDAQSDHGTVVANILSGAANGAGGVGYAPGAEVAVLRISDWNADTQTETLTHFNEALDYAGANGIKVINSSLTNRASSAWGSAVARYAATGGLVVTAAGNTSADAPTDAPAITDANRRAVLFVGAIDPSTTDYKLASYSARAGTMMDRYVVAVGTHYTLDTSGAMTVFKGTSSATPVVTALVADILSKWPQLSGQQAGDIVLATAKDIGDPGVDPVFGHGLVDFQAALAPVSPTLSNGTAQTPLAASVMAVADAVGTVSLQTALSKVTVLDAYGRDYRGSIANLVVQPQVSDPRRIERRVRQINDRTAIAFGPLSGEFAFAHYRNSVDPRAIDATVTSGSVAYAGRDLAVKLAWNGVDSLQGDTMGLAAFADGVLAYAPQADGSIEVGRRFAGGTLGATFAFGRIGDSSAQAVTLGWTSGTTQIRGSYISERGTLMGMPTGAGALRLGSGARTVMAEAHHSLALAGAWRLEGYGSLGVTQLKLAHGSLVTDATPLVASRFGIQASRPAFGGSISLGVGQPLKIESGAARLTYASGYDLASESLIYDTAQASLAGTRRLQLTGGYTRVGDVSSLRLGVMHDTRDGSTSALAGWSVRW
ncbi:peptidase S8 and S53, subtilisin, kexin,sedolisin [Sphingomonas hengshuiensis]|uniref:Peptidase S8 and S53, subtilisin, kexin,sedolisin n=2 Tax=Sphingomonas hengshuiensis TaxID=1609977 RepID=A0A7U4LFH2_9SPHN|nr:peptidase S8 and S53, subtilisin, kexin,sedolisin [Sphingomonas hengshuiensis]